MAAALGVGLRRRRGRAGPGRVAARPGVRGRRRPAGAAGRRRPPRRSRSSTPAAPRASSTSPARCGDPGVYEIGAGARVVEVIGARAGRPGGRPGRPQPRRAARRTASRCSSRRGAARRRPRRTGGARAAGRAPVSSPPRPSRSSRRSTASARPWRRASWSGGDAHGGFASVDQLLDVPGIGPTRLEAAPYEGRAVRGVHFGRPGLSLTQGDAAGAEWSHRHGGRRGSPPRPRRGRTEQVPQERGLPDPDRDPAGVRGPAAGGLERGPSPRPPSPS